MRNEPNPFFESWYLLASLEALDPAERVHLLRVQADGALLGLLPVNRSRRYYGRPVPHMANWLHANCFLGTPLVACGMEDDFWRSMLQWADSNAGAALFLHLGGLPVDGPMFRSLRDVLNEEGRPAALVHREDRAMLCSKLSPAEYLDQSLSPKKRKELRRQFNRLSDEGTVRFSRQTDGEGVEQWLDDFLALEAAGWKGTAGSAMASDAGTSRLFRKALSEAAQRGKLERLSLTLDGSPVAMLVNFIAPPGVFSYKTAFDERYARFSPGVLLQQENLVHLGCDDIAWCDSCATPDHPMIDHIWRERRTIARINIAIGGKVRRAVFRQFARAETGAYPGDIA